DGHEWTVSEDWEFRTGLTNDIMHVSTEETTMQTRLEPGLMALRERFKSEAVFREVIDALLEIDQGTSLRKKKRARHRAQEYFIEDNRLWKLGSSKSIRGEAKRECISQEEATDLAREIHRQNGHFHRDNVKSNMLTKFVSPKLDASIVGAIL
ncbi:hypothetical protein HYPSUDRAFT_107971, partial [Hypholoma sublateritium FD-334 SS-4]